MGNRGRSNYVFDIVIFSMLILAVIFIIVGAVQGIIGTSYFKIILGVWIVALIVINDFAEPYNMGEFDNLSMRRSRLYLLYAVCDAVFYAFLYLFIININKYSEPLHYVFLGLSIASFVGMLMFRKRFKDEPDKDERPSYSGAYVEGGIRSDDDDIKVMILKDRTSK